MEGAFKTLEDYSCEVEQVFYQNGVEGQHHRFKFYFRKQDKIRIDFSHPYSLLTILYREGEKEATVLPLRFLPALRFRFSVDDPTIKTLAGQRIDQTGMGYFIDFVVRNLKRVEQSGDKFDEGSGQTRFLLWAMDYIHEKSTEKYLISISNKYWLPVRIERYSLADGLIEVSEMKNYHINNHLEDRFSHP
jgi:outer membrane lipoprotein-sorting protein